MISTVEGPPDGVRSANERPVTSFSYVYDCGSERSDAFNSELSLYRAASDGKTDVLFVSHLHADHINGIDRLQAMAPAKTVILPYLDVVERLLFILSDFELGAASRSSLDYFENPVDWWLGRGAERVIFLQPGRPDDIPPARGAEPDSPIDDPSAGRRIRLDDAPSKGFSANRLATYMRAPHGPIAEKLTPADPTARQTQSGAFVAASGSYLQLEWQAFTGDAWRRGDWILLPYVHPVDDPARKRFLRDIKKALGFRGNEETKLSKSLLQHLRSIESARRLVEIYNRHFAGGHNAISMSLYSGPLSQRAVASSSHTEPSRQWRSSLEEPPYGSFFWSADGIGWLGTGDAALRQDKWRKPWRTFFEGFDDRIAIITLPHHGSANNFHPDILGFRGLRFALATTLEARNRVSRLRETLGAVELRGIRTRVVDDERLSRFSVTCERSMA
ncbi:hypothetical protein [Rhizobium lusitanum]|uniref:hypothetical protein n=1 Tax=Rhizobium lusitanum TaxID=293958 RepID=UPI00195ADF2E|nr:hypothetical protein [Rhizobium lusitanum]MBM7045537.1 hypothetical protein [Rhizobium lusitanum]